MTCIQFSDGEIWHILNSDECAALSADELLTAIGDSEFTLCRRPDGALAIVNVFEKARTKAES